MIRHELSPGCDGWRNWASRAAPRKRASSPASDFTEAPRMLELLLKS
jgi:hypothetical protein